jgi:hypothetical protein
MLSSLQENSLAVAVMVFIDGLEKTHWSGRPTDFLRELNLFVDKRAHSSRDWPQNAVALSKRLQALQAGLRRQGIDVQLSRGKERRITIIRI